MLVYWALSRRGSPSACSILGRHGTCRSSPGLRSPSLRLRVPTTWFAPVCSTTGRKRRRTTATFWHSCAVAHCSWSAPIPTLSSSAATASSIALEPWPTRMWRLAARRSTAASRTRRSMRRHSTKPQPFAKQGAAACSRARNRRLGQDRP